MFAQIGCYSRKGVLYRRTVGVGISCLRVTNGPRDNPHPPPPSPCPCQHHPVAIEEQESCMAVCLAWPGPICGVCWESQCADCSYVLDSPSDAAGVRSEDYSRLLCRGCAPES